MIHPRLMLEQGRLFAGKEMGQNFLVNPGTAKNIVSKTGITDDTVVLEIGSGLGALTIPIAQAAARVIAVEKDFRLIPLLQQSLDKENIKNVQIINKNVLKLDIKKIAQSQKLVVIGNLPYNISSQILFKLVQERCCIEKAFLMFQKQLAERIGSSPGGRDYSRLSAVAQYSADIGFIADIGPSNFFPKPEVDSRILRFDFFKTRQLSLEQEKVLFDVIKAGFSKRRKSLKNSMAGGEFGWKKEYIIKALNLAGIDEQRRAETLTVEEFISLALSVSAERKVYDQSK